MSDFPSVLTSPETSPVQDEPCAPARTEPEPASVNTASIVQVVIGTSKMAANDDSLAVRIAEVANRANGYQRFSVGEVRSRLAKGDAEPNANRVLHVAYRNGEVVGCCSSTVQVHWGAGGGHWGALAVDPAAQGTGVASALVAAAEQRLLQHGCTTVSIEYDYSPGDIESERLKGWYEGKLGFRGNGCGFRCASKKLSASTVAKCEMDPKINSKKISSTHSGPLFQESSGQAGASAANGRCACCIS